jgi:hypothetical protein
MYSTFPAHTQIAPLLPNSSNSSSSKLPLAAKPTVPKTQNPRPKNRSENGSKNFCQIRVLKPEILSTKKEKPNDFKPQKQILDANSTAAAAATYLQSTDRTFKSVACRMARGFQRAGERAWALHLPPGSLTRHLATQLSQSLCE